MRISFLSRVTVTLIFVSILVTCFINVFRKNIESTYENLSLVQCKSIVTKVVNQVVLDSIVDTKIDVEYEKDELVSYNINQINYLVSSLSLKVVSVLDDINNSNYSSLLSGEIKSDVPGIILEIELGRLFNNVFFNGLGSKYPIKFSLLGDVLASSSMKVEEFGLNNALVSLYLDLSFDFALTLPLTKKYDELDIKIPLSINMIEGDVPSFMLGEHEIEGAASYLVGGSQI